MKRQHLGLLLAAVTVVVILCLWLQEHPDETEVRASSRGEIQQTPSNFQSAEPAPPAPPAAPAPAAMESVPTPDTRRPRTTDVGDLAPRARLQNTTGPELGPGLNPATVMENLRSSFQQYRAQFGGNPVGDNQEITACLNGANPRHAKFINSEDGLRVGDRGELIDNWGTPFFFHQISRSEIEIRSAGPDRKMWTKDDLLLK